MNRTALTYGGVCGLLAMTLALATSAAGQSVIIQTGAYIDERGELTKSAGVVIADGLITQLGGDLPRDARIDSYPRAVLCPGLIDCQGALGVSGGLSERRHAVQPRVNARDAFNKYSTQLAAALEAGVTSFALAPDDQNLVGGRIAICQTSGPDGKPYVLTDQGPLKLSLSPAAFKRDREPTSRGGALGMLRESLTRAKRSSADLANNPLGAFANGKLTGLVAVPSGADVYSLLYLAGELELQVIPIHTLDARQVAEQLAGQVPGVIVGPLGLYSSRRETMAPGLFERHQVPVAIAGGLPGQSADSLRVGAAMAAREGLSPAAARRAITTVPARLLGMDKQIGVIKTGNRADLVVFSGDPLDLRSRVLAVYVGGRRVFQAAPKSGNGD